MEAKLYGQNKGGMSINGIIKDYYAYAKEKIEAGDLVEYVNGIAGKVDYGESVDTQLSTQTNAGSTISAVALDENRVFIAHSYGVDYHLYGVVCRIEGNTITHGTDTGLYISQYGGARVSAVLLQNGDVFIAHSRESAYRLTGTVCKINDMEITVTVKATQLSTMQNTGYTISTCVLPNGNVFIAHNYGNNTQYHLYGMVVTISDTTITAGTDTALVSSTKAGYTISTCLLPNGNVFIAHSYGSDYILYGMLVSISGTTIAAGSNTQLSSSTTTANNVKALLLPSGKIFVAHSKSNYALLYALICTVSGTSITYGEDFLISSANYSAIGMSLALLQNNNVLIAHKDSNNNSSLYGIVCKVEDTTITQGTDTQLNASLYMGDVTSTLFLENGTIFVAHSNSTSYYLNAQIFAIDYDNNIPTNHIVITEYETQVRKVTTGQFDGIAKTEGAGGDDTGHNDLVSIWTKE